MWTEEDICSTFLGQIFQKSWMCATFFIITASKSKSRSSSISPPNSPPGSSNWITFHNLQNVNSYKLILRLITLFQLQKLSSTRWDRVMIMHGEFVRNSGHVLLEGTIQIFALRDGGGWKTSARWARNLAQIQTQYLPNANTKALLLQ